MKFSSQHNVLELIGMPNSGKTSLGKRLEITDSSKRIKYFSFRTLLNANIFSSNDDKMCIESLNSFQEVLETQLASSNSKTILIIDRGLKDKLIFYSVLNELGLISEDPIKLCKNLMIKYSWHLCSSIIFNLPLEIVYKREKNANKNKDRWKIIFKERTDIALHVLYNKYNSIKADHNSIIIDGQTSMDNNFKIVKAGLKRLYGL